LSDAFFLPKRDQEAAVPILFWASVPFAMMQMWFDTCARERSKMWR